MRGVRASIILDITLEEMIQELDYMKTEYNRNSNGCLYIESKKMQETRPLKFLLTLNNLNVSLHFCCYLGTSSEVLYKRPSILLTHTAFSRCGITLIIFPLSLIKMGDHREHLFSVCYGVTQSKLSV